MWNELKERPRRRKRVLKPYASINPRGEIVLNPTVSAHLVGWNYVSLHYDDATGNIAIARPTRTGRVYNVKKIGRKKRLRVVRAMPFLRHFALQIDQTLTFTEIHQHPGPVLVLNLWTAKGRHSLGNL